MINRKTFVTTSAALSFLAVGLAITTYFAYTPELKDGSVRGSRTSSSLESTMSYLEQSVPLLQDLQRILEKNRSYLDDLQGSQYGLKERLEAAGEARAVFVDAKVSHAAWTAPETAEPAHRAFSQFVTHGLNATENYFRYVNLSTANQPDPAVEKEIQRSLDETLLRGQTVEQENTQALSRAGAKFDDTDSDGLPDVWEQIAGTDRTLADTDSDGLTDAEEFHLYLTKPLEADTDLDGFADGTEISSGYNPLGSGRLFGIDNL